MNSKHLPTSMAARGNSEGNRALVILFISLVVDLLAFTVILPLLPSILDHFEQHGEDVVYGSMKSGVSYVRNLVGAPDSPKWNSVLFGGIIGSLFSLLQFFSSPIIGALSDVYGRKPLMIATSVGISLSYALWAYSETFSVFVLSRVVGGISKGNVSLSTVIVGDVTSTDRRNKGMAVVGIAFSVGFLVGPLIGAWFATWVKHSGSPFFYPALYALVLSGLNIFFLLLFLKESLPADKRSTSFRLSRVSSLVRPTSLFNFSAATDLTKHDRSSIKQLGLAYFSYLLIYSGLEFTLTFLTHTKFSFNKMEQGKMFFFMGIIMILVHGVVVRRVKSGDELRTVMKGISILMPSFVLVGSTSNQLILYAGLVFFSYASATVVPCITTEVSHYGADDQKGTIMGVFRSLGALSRTFGPIIVSTIYWCLGPTACYCIGALSLLLPILLLRKVLPKIK